MYVKLLKEKQMKKASIMFSEGGQIGAFISHFDFLYLQKARKPIKRGNITMP